LIEKNKDSEIDLEILRNIEENPSLTQRQMAKELQVSLGKINYLIKSLIEKGSLIIHNFRTSDNKLGYLYVITPQGVEQRRRLTVLFLKRRSEEFDKLKKEMERIENQ
jgi:EPS-associated MarR family transcriptional regulator|tara:strand:- start:203 stop:526 length:324 start_codon:yes stop_codon:yes gene_type:complete